MTIYINVHINECISYSYCINVYSIPYTTAYKLKNKGLINVCAHLQSYYSIKSGRSNVDYILNVCALIFSGHI